MKNSTRGKFCDGVIFSGMLVNAIVIALVLYLYVA
jgi:hypothetical protein